MKDQLTAEQIDYLFAFAKSKHVKYKDMQYEIVDHLATAVETELEAYPFLTFERATERVYGRFPVTGFLQWMDQKEESLTKYWQGRQRQYMFRFLKPPAVFAVVAIIYMVGQMFLSHDTIIISGLMASYLLATLAFTWKNRSLYKQQLLGSQLIVQQTFYKTILFCSFSGSLLPMVFIFDSTIGSIFSTMSVFECYYFATAMTFIIVYNYAAATAFPAMLEEELESKYTFLTTTVTS